MQTIFSHEEVYWRIVKLHIAGPAIDRLLFREKWFAVRPLQRDEFEISVEIENRHILDAVVDFIEEKN